MEEQFPRWVQELPAFPHKALHGPLEIVIAFYREHIKRDIDSGRLEPVDSWVMVRGLLLAATQTYASICLLLSEKRSKPLMLQANILSRALFETLATVVALTEDPAARSRVLARESYKQLLLRLQHLTKRFGGDEKWTGYLGTYRKGLAMTAKRLKLSSEEERDPSAIADEWPTPGVMVYGRARKKVPPFVSGSRLAVLKEIYEYHYPAQSAQAHARLLSLGIAMLVDDPSQQWQPGSGESNIVGTAMLFLACIFSEVEATGRYDRHPKLLELWAYLREMDDEAKDLWDLRYAGLSAEKEAEPPHPDRR